MQWWKQLIRRITGRSSRDLDRELSAHLDLETEEQAGAGMPPAEARFAARRVFGNTTLVTEDVRATWGWSRFEQLAQDLGYAVRTIRKSPGFALTAILSLALGIGANTAIFTVVNAVLLRPLPFPEPHRLVQIWESKPSEQYFRNVVNPFNFLDWRERTHSFESMAAVSTITANLTGLGDPLALPGMQVSPDFFSILGVSPVVGRSFIREEGLPGHEHVVILSFALWQSHFGGDAGVIGRKIVVNGVPDTVVGVLARGFTLPRNKADLFTPLPIVRSKEWAGGRFLTVIARLKPGVTLQRAREDLHTVAAQIANERPAADKGWSAEAIPMLADATEAVRLPLLVLLTAVTLVLLIACTNVANLLLMRAAGRLREIAIRAALGAGKRRLMQQLFSESLLLASSACAVGLVFAYWSVKILLATLPRESQLPRMEAIHLDSRVFLFAFGLAIVSAMIFGLVPSLRLSQSPHSALQLGAVQTAVRSGLRQWLVVAEIALSLVLLAGAGLMLRSFHRLISVDPGFETQHVLTMGMFASPAKYSDNRKRAAYFASLLSEIRTVPAIQDAGSVHFLPLEERTSASCFGRFEDPPPIPSTAPDAEFLVISPGYFQVMRTPLVSGRQFEARDRFDAPSVIMVNQEFVRRYLPNRNPIGQKLNLCWTVRNPAEILGVIGDARQSELRKSPKPTIFINNFQAPMYFAQLVVRTSGDPSRTIRAIEAAIHRVDSDQALTHIQTMDQVFSDAVAQPRMQLVLLLIFGGIAALLAIVGIYGVTAYSVAQRTREIGIRMALGAQPADVGRMVLREGALLAITGIAVGFAAALALTRVLRSLLFETTATDAPTFACVAGIVLAIVLLATLIPARRALRVDPTTALRHE